jgi:hypothetical protein
MRFCPGARVALSCVAGLALLPAVASAQPGISSTAPQAVAPGQSTDLKLRGGSLAGPTEFWSNIPGAMVALPTDVAGNGTNAAEITYRVQLPPDVPVGVYGVRMANASGVSNLKLVMVDDLPSVAQVRPNQALANAQAITIPAAVDGYVDNLSRDYYKFAASAGQRITIEVLGRRLGSPLDPMIRLLDAKGRELAYSDDAAGIAPDSLLSFTIKETGDYIVEVRDIRFQGGGNFFYRLRIGDFPAVTVPYPMGIQKGAAAQVGFAGIAVDGVPALPVNLPGDSPLQWLSLSAKGAGAKSSGFGVVSVGTAPEAVEVEPNNEAAQSTRVPVEGSLNGRFDKAGDVDRFVFTAKAGTRFIYTAVTRQAGSPCDLFLRLLKADGAEVASADDVGTNDAVLDYTFPADGDYTLVVEDLHRRGGTEFAYRIAVTPFAEKFDLAASADTLNIPAGGLVTVTVSATRNSFAGPIELSLAGAPEGIVATPTVIGPGLASTVLTIAAAPNAPAGKIHNLKIVGKSTQGAVTHQAVATVSAAQRAAFSALPVPPPALAETVAVGVMPAPLFVLKTDKPEIVFGKDLSATVKVISTRTGDFAEEIALAVLPAQNGLPPGVTAAVKPVPKGANEVEIVFAANNQAPLGQFSAVLLGTGKQGNATGSQPIPALTLRLAAPFELKPDFGGAKITKGGKLKIKVTAVRNPAFAGPITLAFANLPKGVAAPATMIPADKGEVELELEAAADAAVGAVNNIVVNGEGMNGNAKVAAGSANVALTVE